MRATSFAALASLALLQAATAAPAKAPAAAPDRAKIAAAIPEKAFATPKNARTILVFSVTNGFRHDSIPWGIAALEEMGKKTGAFTTVVSDDLANFEADKLAGFDVVVFNNTTQNVFMPGKAELAKMDEAAKAAAKERELRLRKNFIEFIRSGKGFVGIHAATDTFYEWPEFGFMLGAQFDGHPWGANTRVSVKVEKPDHPVNQGLKDISHLEFNEECYQFKAYSAERQDVLLRLDTERSDMNVKGIKRTDNDFPLSWVRGHGQGRVYYSALGHNKHIYENPKVLAHYLAGIQWAAGDLAAPPPPADP